MMCRLWGLHDSANFTIEMVPLMEAAVNNIIMDWATILSDKLAIAVLDFRNQTVVSERKIPPFYYSAYIVDTLCFNSEFPVIGWRWTPQDPTAIHIYHQKLWKTSYKHHLYQICNGFMVPIYYSIFDKPIPKISYQASFDLTSVGSWFGEEKFTYIRVFGSQANPHVLPLYIPDKLLAREIAYQIMAESTTQTLKKEKKRGWPSFPLRCGVYTLHDLKLAEKEATKIKSLTLATIPNRPFDPKKVSYNALEQAKLTKFEHKEDTFDDLFISTESIGQARELARIKYNDEGLTEFNKLREQRLQTLPLDLLATTPATSSSEPDRQQSKEPPVITKEQQRIQEEKQRREKEEKLKREQEEQQKKQQEKVRKEPQAEKEKQTTIDVNIDTHVDPKLIKEWEQFDSIISGLECSKDTDTSKVADTQGITSPQVLSGTSGSPISKDVEIIPKDPSEQIILQVEDIPPLDVFYSPRHKAVVKRQRKK